MNIEERLALNKQKINGLLERIKAIDLEKESLLQEALRLDGENRILNEQLAEANPEVETKEKED